MTLLLKTESFKPLTSAAPVVQEQSEFRATVVPNSNKVRPFQSLDQQLPVSEETAATVSQKKCEPRVSVQRDGNIVTSIRIECSCGQVIDVACVYDTPPKQA